MYDPQRNAVPSLAGTSPVDGTNPPHSPAQPAARGELEQLYTKVTWRLIPLLFFCYLMNYVDRANIGFAQLQMKDALGFSDTVYGLGAAMFFVGYLLCEVPSNLLLKRFGARLTILRIMLLWGITSAATLLVTTPAQFFVVRFLLGVFEAGFFPGVALYLTFWYPPQRRARIFALFMTAQVASAFISSPLSGWILQNLHGVHGWAGWQWMFLLEALPTLPLGVLAFYLLPDGPQRARWLSAPQQQALLQELREDAAPANAHGFRHLLRDPRVYLLAFAYFVIGCGGYFMAFWVPTMVHEAGVSDLQKVGLYAVLPNIFGLFAMVLYGRSADRRNRQRQYFAAALWVGAAGLLALAFNLDSGLFRLLACITLGGCAVVAAGPVFWAMVTRYLPRAEAPVGIAFINSLACTAGTSPALVGLIKSHTGSLQLAVLLFAGLFAAAALAIGLLMRDHAVRRPA